MMIWLIKGPILLLTLGIWTVVGLVFWIPLLARSTAVFSTGILLSTLAGRGAYAYGRQLDMAISFYANGFRHIIESLTKQHTVETPIDPPLPIWRFLGESLWATVFWIGIFFITERLWLGGEAFRHAEVGFKMNISPSKASVAPLSSPPNLVFMKPKNS